MYYYKTGQFVEAFQQTTTPNIYRLWSLLFTADKQLIVKHLADFIREVQRGSAVGVWDRRANLYLQVLYLTNREFEAFIDAANRVTELVNADEHDNYFTSLGVLLQRLSKNTAVSFVTGGRNEHLIGDSHVLPLSCSWNRDKSIVTFLPGVTLRELSSTLKLPAHYAFENAVSLRSSDRLVFSVGEIDQREIYYRIDAIIREEAKMKQRLQNQIRAGLEFVASMRSPFQDICVLALPRYFENVVPKYNQSHKVEIEKWVNWFADVYHESAEAAGLAISGKPALDKAALHDKLDMAHFKPEFYEGFFD